MSSYGVFEVDLFIKGKKFNNLGVLSLCTTTHIPKISNFISFLFAYFSLACFDVFDVVSLCNFSSKFSRYLLLILSNVDMILCFQKKYIYRRCVFGRLFQQLLVAT